MTHSGRRDRSRNKRDASEIQRASSDALGHGFTIAAAIGLFLWAGNWADEALGTSPLLALSGMMLGAAAGFFRLYAHLTHLNRKDVESDPSDEDSA